MATYNFPVGQNAIVVGQTPPIVARRKPQVAASKPMQGRVKDDGSGRTRYTCSLCEVIYYVHQGSKPKCPVCAALDENLRLKNALSSEKNKGDLLYRENMALKTQVDNLEAMKSALDLCSDGDIAWIKQVLYRWQSDRTKTALKATHSAPKGRGSKRRAPVDGFIAMFRGAEPEVYTCNSVGGMALAGYLEEATSLVGPVRAIEVLARAVMSRMTGEVP